MALPGNTVTAAPVITPFIGPDSMPYDPFVVHEYGGFDIQNVGNAGFIYIWKCEYKNNSIIVSSNNGHEYTALSELHDLVSIDMSFDQNMNYAIAYEKAGTSYLYWFDTTVGHYVTTTFTNTRSPRVSLDDKRREFASSSDIIFAYVKSSGSLVYRQQRDRFTIERTLKTGIPSEIYLQKIGMSSGNRFIFELAPYYQLPVCTI